jgi:hypothetical protein
MSTRTTLAIDNHTCPTCGCEYERLSHHWNSGSCPWPELTRSHHDLVTGLLLGDAMIGSNSNNKHLVLVTTNRSFAVWVFKELDWLAHSLVRVDPSEPTDSTEQAINHRYRVRTIDNPEFTPYCEWYDASDEKRIPLHLDLPVQSARAWYACSGGVRWQTDDSHRSAVFSAHDEKRATRIAGLLERTEFEPTRTGKRVQLPPRETRAFLNWIGDPVPGVGYKWAAERAVYDDFRREQRAERWWLALHPERETRVKANKNEATRLADCI